MMRPLSVATVQFENASGNKAFNLERIARYCAEAAAAGASVVAFHECAVTGYTFARRLSRKALTTLAEPVPSGPSVAALTDIAARHDIHILTGLFEVDSERQLYNTYVCIGPAGLVARHRKLHPFISTHLVPGEGYTVFDIDGWCCGILICYDNNVVENVRATTLLGADVVFMPHVTMCTPSTRPGAGFVDPALWAHRDREAAALRAEFEGLKGRAWLMKWLPARAYDNGIYVVFSNPIGMDDDQLKNGCAMIIDPFGDVIGECNRLEEGYTVANLTLEKLTASGGYRYRNARRPALYRHIIGAEHNATQRVAWLPGD